MGEERAEEKCAQQLPPRHLASREGRLPSRTSGVKVYRCAHIPKFKYFAILLAEQLCCANNQRWLCRMTCKLSSCSAELNWLFRVPKLCQEHNARQHRTRVLKCRRKKTKQKLPCGCGLLMWPVLFTGHMRLYPPRSAGIASSEAA